MLFKVLTVCAIYFLTGKPLLSDPQKTILVIGTRDCRKNTLIDCFLNYILAPNWNEGFTLRVTDGSAQSREMHVFSIPSTTLTQLPFGVHIVNTPKGNCVKVVEGILNTCISLFEQTHQ